MHSEHGADTAGEGLPPVGAVVGVGTGLCRVYRTPCAGCGVAPASLFGPLCGECREEALAKVTYRPVVERMMGVGGSEWRARMMGKRKKTKDRTVFTTGADVEEAAGLEEVDDQGAGPWDGDDAVD